MIVIESSAMVDALIGDPVNEELLSLIGSEELHAPSLLDFEVTSALRGHLLGGLIDTTVAGAAIDDFAALTIQRHAMTPLLAEVLDLRDNFTVYDAAYVVLAQALTAPLVTADRKLLEARRMGVTVRLVRA